MPTIVTTKTLAPTTPHGFPCPAARAVRNGPATRANNRPTPWLTLLAISSPVEG